MSFTVATCHNFWRLQRMAYGATTPNGTPNLQTPLAGMIQACARSAGKPSGCSLRGLPDQARRAAERTLVLAGSLSHPPSIAFGHRWVAFSFLIVRDRHGCEGMGARCVAIAEKFDLPYFRWVGRYLMGWGKAEG